MHFLLFISLDWLIFCHVIILYKFTRLLIYFLFLSDEGPMLETLDYTIRIGSIPNILYFDFYLSEWYLEQCVFSFLFSNTQNCIFTIFWCWTSLLNRFWLIYWICLWRLIVQVSEIFTKNIDGSGWRFDGLRGGHLQSQVRSDCQVRVYIWFVTWWVGCCYVKFVLWLVTCYVKYARRCVGVSG